MVFLWFSVPFDQRKILHDLQQRLLIRKVQGLGEVVVEVPGGTLGIFPTDLTRKKWDFSSKQLDLNSKKLDLSHNLVMLWKIGMLPSKFWS